MRKILLYILVMAAALLVPEQGTDVGKLLPVELVFLYKEKDQVIIETDTGDMGSGETIEEAFQNLEDTAPGVIFLDAADYLLVARSAKGLLPEMAEYMKPNTRVCQAEKGIDLVEAARYLGVHRPETRIGSGNADAQLPMLQQEKASQKIILKISNYPLTKS